MDSYKQWLSSQSGKEPLMMNDIRVPFAHSDIHLIAPMVEYLGDDAPQPRLINVYRHKGAEKDPKNYRYRCKHFDRKTRNCTIYEIRPWMCRHYPGPIGCRYAACTWEERKQEKRPKSDIQKKTLGLDLEKAEARIREATGGMDVRKLKEMKPTKGRTS